MREKTYDDKDGQSREYSHAVVGEEQWVTV